MMGVDDPIQRILQHVKDSCTTRAPASNAQLEQLRRDIGHELPDDYVRFLQLTDGMEGFISENEYVLLWRCCQLAGLNRDYSDTVRAPQLILFGTDGGDGGFGFDMRVSSGPVVAVPLIDMSTEYYTPIADTFTEFLQKLASGYDYLEDANYPEGW